MNKTKQFLAVPMLMAAGLRTAHADYDLNLMQGVTEISNEIYDLHMLILGICVLVGIAVFGVMFYSIYHHRKSKGHVAAQFHENATVEFVWTVIPTIILVCMAVPATKAMIRMDKVEDTEMSIKITGWQWKWEYEYQEDGAHFFSSLDEASNKARQVGSGVDPKSIPNYLLNVDRPLVIPTNTKIRFLLTAADVIHSWWVPDLGWKRDTVPGFVNAAWTYVEKPGTYRGQCAELCGKDHGFMPIVVVAVSPDEYETWVDEFPDGGAGEFPPGTWAKKAGCAAETCTNEELLEIGQSVYTSNCSSCHMENGAGIPGTFPALTGSPVVTGDKDAQIKLVMDGKGMMPAFGAQLSAAELAGVISYTRNDLGNSVGDWAQPNEISAK